MTNDRNEPGFDPIDEALRTYPLAPAPARLQTLVMRNVRARRQMPAFAFPWLEASLSLLATVMLTAFSYMLLSIPPETLRLVEQGIRRMFSGAASGPTTAAFGGLALAGVCALAAALIFASPRIWQSFLRPLRR
jgi:hypothetical protein